MFSCSGASRPGSSSNRRSPLGNDSATPHAPASNGCSQPKRPGPKWVARILSSILFPTHPSKSHNHCAAVLGAKLVRFAPPSGAGAHGNHGSYRTSRNQSQGGLRLLPAAPIAEVARMSWPRRSNRWVVRTIGSSMPHRKLCRIERLYPRYACKVPAPHAA
jgi:hypothetical protein